ncbi:MAG: hypothetical protein J2P21_05060 [Chloracidobacterium sp.]|nr:hypothetical protein [Chloracidobacterium sp.]
MLEKRGVRTSLFAPEEPPMVYEKPGEPRPGLMRRPIDQKRRKRIYFGARGVTEMGSPYMAFANPKGP